MLGPLACLGDSPTGPSGREYTRAYLESLIDHMEAGSLNRHAIDWPAFREEVMALGADARRLREAIPAIRRALDLLEDDHSYFRTALGEFVLGTTRPACSPYLAPPLVGLPPDVGYVRVRAYSGSAYASGTYSGDIQRAMAASDNDSTIGWIVDLRGNYGGNMWPMLAAIWPFLQGEVGYFVDADGAWSTWSVSADRALLDNTVIVTVPDEYAPIGADGRIAVLTDNAVASSGEAVTVAFRGMARARSFGTATCGQPTGVIQIPLADGSSLGLTVARFADRDSVRYYGPIVPDETISDEATLIARAVAWIRDGN